MVAATQAGKRLREGTAVLALSAELLGADCQALVERCRTLEQGLRDGAVQHVVIDCRLTSGFGCAALGLLLRLSKVVDRCGGRFALCGLSPLEREILWLVRLHRRWPVYASRGEALQAVGVAPGMHRPSRRRPPQTAA
jgi:anti-anti-sigma factor